MIESKNCSPGILSTPSTQFTPEQYQKLLYLVKSNVSSTPSVHNVQSLPSSHQNSGKSSFLASFSHHTSWIIDSIPVLLIMFVTHLPFSLNIHIYLLFPLNFLIAVISQQLYQGPYVFLILSFFIMFSIFQILPSISFLSPNSLILHNAALFFYPPFVLSRLSFPGGRLVQLKYLKDFIFLILHKSPQMWHVQLFHLKFIILLLVMYLYILLLICGI